jgi:hypothetical protein
MDDLGQRLEVDCRLRFRNMRLWLASLLILGITFGTYNVVEAETLAGASLVQHLRQGGYVLLMRHAHSSPEPPASGLADAANTNLERQLDETGLSTARAMGNAIRKLRIPIGTVLSSPTFRALETVRLAGLGPVETFVQLGDGGQSMKADAVAGQANWLRDKVAERPRAGSNTIIVTQMPNIQVAFSQNAADLADGELLVFHSDRNGRPGLVAKIKIEDWPALTNR